MILADTSIWIEFLRQSNADINEAMTSYLEDGEIITVSAIFGELLQGVKNENEREVILDFWDSTPNILEENLFIEAGKFSSRHKLFNKGIGLIDCLILVAAINNGHELWTLDKKLLEAYKQLTI